MAEVPCVTKQLVTYRDIGLSLGVVESELQWWVLVEEGKEALGPEGRDEVFILEPPVEAKHSVEVQGQTAAVVHHDTKLLPLESKPKLRYKAVNRCKYLVSSTCDHDVML